MAIEISPTPRFDDALADIRVALSKEAGLAVSNFLDSGRIRGRRKRSGSSSKEICLELSELFAAHTRTVRISVLLTSRFRYVLLKKSLRENLESDFERSLMP